MSQQEIPKTPEIPPPPQQQQDLSYYYQSHVPEQDYIVQNYSHDYIQHTSTSTHNNLVIQDPYAAGPAMYYNQSFNGIVTS